MDGSEFFNNDSPNDYSNEHRKSTNHLFRHKSSLRNNSSLDLDPSPSSSNSRNIKSHISITIRKKETFSNQHKTLIKNPALTRFTHFKNIEPENINLLDDLNLPEDSYWARLKQISNNSRLKSKLFDFTKLKNSFPKLPMFSASIKSVRKTDTILKALISRRDQEKLQKNSPSIKKPQNYYGLFGYPNRRQRSLKPFENQAHIENFPFYNIKRSNDVLPYNDIYTRKITKFTKAKSNRSFKRNLSRNALPGTDSKKSFIERLKEVFTKRENRRNNELPIQSKSYESLRIQGKFNFVGENLKYRRKSENKSVLLPFKIKQKVFYNYNIIK